MVLICWLGQRPPFVRVWPCLLRRMDLLCLAGERSFSATRGKALLFLRIEPSSLRDQPDMRCSVCLAGPPGSVRREAGFLPLAAAREALPLLAPRGKGAAVARPA